MRRRIPIWLTRAVMLITLGAFAGIVALQAHWNEPGSAFKATSQQDKEKEARLFAAGVQAAFNRHDIKAVAGMFLSDGELVDANGNVLKTREVIESHYADIFTLG